jgi:alkaline phosphatase D
MRRNGSLILSSLAIVMIILLFGSCTRFSGNGYSSSWEKYPDSRWTGPDLWANRLADWEVRDGWLICTGNMPLRTVHLMTRRVGPEEGNIMTLVKIRKESKGNAVTDEAAGVLIGAGSSLDYRSASLIFHSWGEGAGLFIGIDGEGKVFVRDLEKEKEYPAYAENGIANWQETILRITTVRGENSMAHLSIIAIDPFSKRIISEITDLNIESDRLTGNIALVSHHGREGENGSLFSFSHWEVRGSRLQSHRERNTGPIVTAQYTLSRGTLKMTAQLMPVTKDICDSVELQFTDEGRWQTVARAAVDTPSYTASFRLPDFRGSDDRSFRLVADYVFGKGDVNTLSGTIRHDPAEKDEIKLLSLSCTQQVIKPDPTRWAGIDAGYFPFEWGVLYPHTRMTGNMKKQKPDLLFFAGDQVYESASPTAAVYGENAIDDYLYKWYLWCFTYRDLTTTIPSITIPDDHDVYQGNLWGCGGRPTPPGIEGAAAQDAGGYRMPARFVNMVQKTQTSHLPDPVDPQPAEQGIGVYFTECNVGGVSLAVIEDRKFKSAPADLLPAAMIVNGWTQNPRWNPSWRTDTEDATLLGERQYAFLEDWAADWTGRTWMKAVLSQALWANLATLPDSATSDAIVPFLEIPDSGIYVKGDRIVADFDSDGWPQGARNKALKIIRKAFALHICGDQHLPSTIQYGTDSWGDASYAIISPATGNIFPRRWFPPDPGRNKADSAPAYTGEYSDGFGNKITVYAVANPHKSKVFPARQNELVTGYSVITFHRITREIELANWPGYADPVMGKPFPGWPITIKQADNYGRKTIGWLPEIVTRGLSDPVIRVISESTGEMIYNLRISGNSYQPAVFYYGPYTIEAGDPDSDLWQKVEGIQAWTSRERQQIVLVF